MFVVALCVCPGTGPLFFFLLFEIYEQSLLEKLSTRAQQSDNSSSMEGLEDDAWVADYFSVVGAR